MPTFDPVVISATLLAVIVLLAVGLLRLTRRPAGPVCNHQDRDLPTGGCRGSLAASGPCDAVATATSLKEREPAPIKPQPASVGAPPALSPDVVIQRTWAAFHQWLAQNENRPDMWVSFDQLVRELLVASFGTRRVRCYQVRPGADRPLPISLGGRAGPGPGQPAAGGTRDALLEHVAANGREYVLGDPSHGPLVDDLAASAPERWAWVWPIRDGRSTIGLVAVGPSEPDVSANADGTNDQVHARPAAGPGRPGPDPGLRLPIRQTLGPLISLCWQHVACLDQLKAARRTDRATGLLTRSDFFALAREALADSYSMNEPVVLLVFGLEGLRRLDDTACWQQRDLLIQNLGHLIASRTRSDDLVGRFTDDRFALLLRRLDAGLGRLIAEKMLAAANQRMRELAGGLEAAGKDFGTLQPDGTRVASTRPGDQTPVRLRIGLAASGLTQPSLEELMQSALRALEQARREKLDLAESAPGQTGPAPQ